MVTTAEEVRRCIGAVLSVDPRDCVPNKRLHELGMESFLAVRLHLRLAERTGVRVPLEAFVGATVGSLTSEVDTRRGTGDAAVDTASEPAPVRREIIEADLTPIQASYWVGREPDLPLGGVATFYYFEFDRAPEQFRAADPLAEVAALEASWNRLITHHDMLRAVVTEQGRQRIEPPGGQFRIGLTDLRERADDHVAALDALRHDRSHQVRDTTSWPLFDIHAALLPGGDIRIYTGFDIIALDMASWILLMRQWGLLMADPTTELPSATPTFLQTLAERDQPDRRRSREVDRDYWTERAVELPPGPRLPYAAALETIQQHRFQRYERRLDPTQWSSLTDRAAARGLSSTAVLLAAFGLTLTRWGATDPFCLNATLFDRPDTVDTDHAVVGDFSTTVLVEMGSATVEFTEYARQVNARFWADLSHRSFSGVEVQRVQGGDPAPRYPVVFTSGVGLGQAEESATAWLGTEVFGVSQTPQVVLDHLVWDEPSGLRIAWDAVTEALPPNLVTAMLDAELRLLTLLAADDSAWDRPDLGWNPYFEDSAPLPERARGAAGPRLADPQYLVAHERPDTPAIVGPSGTLTHNDLVRRARAHAATLADVGVAPGDRVAVAIGKSIEQLVAAYAVLWAGATFVPVEPDWPAARIGSVCSRADIRHALVLPDSAAALPDSILEHEVGEYTDGSEIDVPRDDAGDLAYVIFTSGSTGEPKGVAINHRAARNTIDDINDRFTVGSGDRVLGLSALSFDLSIYDAFGVLGAGGALVVPEPDRMRDPAHWCELIGRHAVTVWNTAPAVAEMLVEYAEADSDAAAALSSLRLMLLSGDWIPVTLPDRLRTVIGDVRVVGLGGATEAAIWSVCHPIDEVRPDWTSIPYGRALRDQYFLILDEAGGPCPVGVPGELHIGGAGLARGYVGDPEQTAARFVEHPRLGTRLYRTGDIGRWRADGTIEFLGRADRQVKIRGHRIELGEIEAVVTRLPEVRQCVAAAIRGVDDRPRLVSYVTGENGHPDPERLDILARERLPDYMVPTRWVLLDRIPLTTNGKVDQARLPNPFRDDAQQPRPVTSTPEPAPVGSVSRTDWLTSAAEESYHRGLALTVRLDTGSLAGSAALTAAADWTAELRAHAAEHGLLITETLSDGPGIIELGIAAPSRPATTQSLPEPPQIAANGSPGTARTEPEVPVGDRPRPELEQAVAEVFDALLGPGVVATTSLYDLGATSMTLIVAHRKLRQLAPALTVLDMFRYSTIRDLAAFIDATPRSPHTPAPTTAHNHFDLATAAARGRRRNHYLKGRQTPHVAG